MVRNRLVDIELAEPAVGEVQLDRLAEAPLVADAVAIAHDEHPDHELGVDRGAADVAVVGRELLAQVGERGRHEHVHAPQKVLLRDAVLEPELVEKLALIPPPPPDHRRAPRR